MLSISQKLKAAILTIPATFSGSLLIMMNSNCFTPTMFIAIVLITEFYTLTRITFPGIQIIQVELRSRKDGMIWRKILNAPLFPNPQDGAIHGPQILTSIQKMSSGMPNAIMLFPTGSFTELQTTCKYAAMKVFIRILTHRLFRNMADILIQVFPSPLQMKTAQERFIIPSTAASRELLIQELLPQMLRNIPRLLFLQTAFI